MSQFSAEQTLQRALQHHQAGQLPQAETLYRQILTQQPKHADALHYLGVIAGQLGRTEIALDLIRQALALQPGNAEAHNNLGNVLKDAGQVVESIAACRHAIALKPNFPEAYNNLGIALRKQGQLEEAIASYRRAIELNPSYPEAFNNLGAVLGDMGRPAEAVAAYCQAITLKPNYPQAHYNLGTLLRGEGRLDESIAVFRQAIILKPNYAEAHFNLGIAYGDNGQLAQAIVAYRQAIAVKPSYPKAFCNLGNAFKNTGKLADAIAAYRQAITLMPTWAEAHSNLVLALHYPPNSDGATIAREHQQWNQLHAEPLKQLIRPHSNDRNPQRRLRVGYVSADFRDHPVGRFVLPLLTAHDQTQVEIFAYAQVARPDAITEHIRGHVHQWRDTAHLTDEQLAEQIRSDQIDILIDLAGHTASNRLPVFARKPAPVQATWLGYPNTTGLEAMDYRLTDALADPPGESDTLCSERLIRLPQTAWCFAAPHEDLPPAEKTLDAATPIIFGSFNNFAKITAPMLELWARILRSTPRSRLLIKAKSLRCETTSQQLRQTMAAMDISSDRLEVLEWRQSHEQHLQSYRQMHIALDTFPYHGTSTTCEALWMGVPVLTLAGITHVSRVGVSILTNVGLPELVAQSPEEYVRLAIELAHDLSRLSNLRSTLRQRMEQSPLMDAPRFARNIEAGYRQMWRTWCET